ncbi:MAG TPA: hypothetical protein VGL56_01375 [Fimbriimonadaceae bacterium]
MQRGLLMPDEPVRDNFHRLPRPFLKWVTIGASRDRAERDAFGSNVLCGFQTVPVAGIQKFLFPAVSAAPYWPRRVSYVPVAGGVPSCYHYIARSTAARSDSLKFQQKPAPGRHVDRAINAPASAHERIGGVHDHVHVLVEYASANNDYFAFSDIHADQDLAAFSAAGRIEGIQSEYMAALG